MPASSSPDEAQYRRIGEAVDALMSLGWDSNLAQQAAPGLLALLNLNPKSKWSSATNRPMSEKQILDFVKEHYPGTRPPSQQVMTALLHSNFVESLSEDSAPSKAPAKAPSKKSQKASQKARVRK